VQLGYLYRGLSLDEIGFGFGQARGNHFYGAVITHAEKYPRGKKNLRFSGPRTQSLARLQIHRTD